MLYFFKVNKQIFYQQIKYERVELLCLVSKNFKDCSCSKSELDE